MIVIDTDLTTVEEIVVANGLADAIKNNPEVTRIRVMNGDSKRIPYLEANEIYTAKEGS